MKTSVLLINLWDMIMLEPPEGGILGTSLVGDTRLCLYTRICLYSKAP